MDNQQQSYFEEQYGPNGEYSARSTTVTESSKALTPYGNTVTGSSFAGGHSQYGTAASVTNASSNALVRGVSGQSYQMSSSGMVRGTSATAAGVGMDSRVVSTVLGEARATGRSQVISTRTGEARFTGETNIVSQHLSGSQVVGTQVVGTERGAERQLSVTEVAVGEEVIGEKTQFVGKGRRGRKVIREEVIEKVIVVPETIQIEEWVEDEYDMEETIVEVAKKFQIEKTVEVPEIEIVEKLIEQIETVVREKIIEVPKIETIERIVEVPVIQTVEKIVEVPEVQYNDVPVEKIIEIPEYKTEEVIREVKKPQFVDKTIEQKKLIADTRALGRKLPVPVEAETIVEFTVPSIRANYIKKKFPVYLPRFIEVPVSKQFVDAGLAAQNEKYTARLSNLMNAGHAVSLCEIEQLASEYKDFENRNSLTQKKISSATVDDTTKRTMFQSYARDMEKHAVYTNLPVEISELHIGHYTTNNLGSCITYSSSQFGGSLTMSGATMSIGGSSIAMGTAGSIRTMTHQLPSTAMTSAYGMSTMTTSIGRVL